MSKRFIALHCSVGVKKSIAFLLVVGSLLFFSACSSNQAVPNKPNTASNFVIRSGAQLLLHGQPFRFAGANIYWLGLDENVGGVAYPTHFRVDDAFAAVAEMGATVVRAHTLGISVGCSLCVEPSLNTFNETALEYIDYAVKSAAEHHIRLIIPLTDNWHYYHGGKHTFTDWRGINNENKFYTDPTVIHDFEHYISTLLNHVNLYTGIAYKDDPTILAWETGNELVPPVTWTKTIAGFIKGIDSHHLIIDGSSFVNSDAFSLSNVDIYTSHYYPANITQMQSDAAQVTAAKKVFYVGEYSWIAGDPLDAFLAAIEKSQAVGDTYWDFFPHSDTYGYVQHNDSFTLHYPGDTSSMRAAVQLLRAHAYRMQGHSEPPVGLPGVPLITSIQGKALAWRGTALGDRYTIERSSTGENGPWLVICDRCATDNQSPWIDKTRPSGSPWYRVQAYNLAGIAGPYSPAYQSK